MPTYIVTPQNPSQRRSDAKNFVVNAASVGAAKTASEQMVGAVAGTFTNWDVTELIDSTTDFVFESSNGPVGRKAGSVFKQLTRGGDHLKA